MPRKEMWKAIPMELIHEDQGKRLLQSDSPWLGSHALIFRPTAISALGTLLYSNGELLPLLCPEAELSIFNATHVLDALDQAVSDILRLPTGKLIWIKRHVFRPEVVLGVDVFKITGTEVSQTFVSERFVRTWKSSGLRGLEFQEVWRSSNPDPSSGVETHETQVLRPREEGDMVVNSHSDELRKKFQRLGADDPKGWADSQLDEGIPQLARFLFLRQAWRNVVPEDNPSWIEAYIRAAESKPDEPYAGIGHSLKRLRARGATDEEITDLVRGMQAEFLFQFCYLLDDPGAVEPEVADVQWALVQVDDEGNVLGQMTGLHEDVLATDPTGREMRPRANPPDPHQS